MLITCRGVQLDPVTDNSVTGIMYEWICVFVCVCFQYRSSAPYFGQLVQYLWLVQVVLQGMGEQGTGHQLSEVGGGQALDRSEWHHVGQGQV